LKNNKKAKNSDGQFTSSNYSAVSWNEVQPVFSPIVQEYVQNSAELPEEFDLFRSYLQKVSICFKDLTGKEAKRLYFITPIIVAVCSAFNGGVTILVEEDLNGGYIKANGRFEMVLVKGNIRVCIVEAKKDDMEQGMAQCLLGCEVITELDKIDTVYGIVTNYQLWTLTKTTDEIVYKEELSLDIDNKMPTEEALRKITGKIYKMLLDG
jgi:hypothetical protein